MLLTVFVAAGCAKDASPLASNTTAHQAKAASTYQPRTYAASHTRVDEVAPTESYRKVVRRAVRSRLHQVAACYGAAAMFDQSIAGKVVVRFSIAPEGQVGSAEVTECDHNTQLLEACVVDTVQRWTFEPPPRGRATAFVYPFQFRPAL